LAGDRAGAALREHHEPVDVIGFEIDASENIVRVGLSASRLGPPESPPR
jgi:hypothetical protein